MKKFVCVILVLVMILSCVCACAPKKANDSEAVITTNPENTNNSETKNPENTDNSNNSELAGKKILVVYFSQSGNTQSVANYIHESVDGDIVKITPTKAYPSEYNSLIDYAKKEQENDERPTFENLGVNVEEYDVIFVGYPIWWYTIPMIMHTFFDTYDFAGKTIIPFNTHEGSRDSGTYDLIKQLESEANVLDGFNVRGNSASSDETKKNIESWLESIGF